MIAEFEWDDGNWPKCGKHGLTKAQIEAAFRQGVFLFDDPFPAQYESRRRAIGKTTDGRHIFVAFTLRQRDGQTVIRPISARFMHAKEIEHYERQIKDKKA